MIVATHFPLVQLERNPYVSVCWLSGSLAAMLVPSFGPTMNVIAYSPFQDGVSAEAVCGSDWAIASGTVHKPMRVLRQSGAMGLSSRLATALELGCAVTTLNAHTQA